MSAATKRPWITGHCNPSNPERIHALCKVVVQGHDCSCSCHQVKRTLVTEHAELVEVDYRSPEWYAARREGVSASEIAAVLGISPWVSAFDLWWEKRTGEGSQSENKSMRRGRRYEALILEDFADEHPELHVAPSVTVRSIERPWQVATPDGLAYEAACYTEAGPVPVAPIEAKTGQRHEWGEPGTDEVPIHYRAQVLWQMDVLGLNVAFLPVLFGDTYTEYVVGYDEADVKLMREAAEEFLCSVREDRVPEIDAHTATTRRLKKLHPSLTDDVAEVPATLLRNYQAARKVRDRAAERMRLAENKVRDLLGPAAKGEYVDSLGTARTFSRSVIDMPERTQTMRAHTRDSINWPRKAVQ